MIAEFSVEPSTIERGQSAVLRWNVTGSNNVADQQRLRDGAGHGHAADDAAANDHLYADGQRPRRRCVANRDRDRDRARASAAAANSNTTSTNRGTLESRVQSDLQDALFDYDSNNIRDDARVALTADADALKRILADFPTANINVEGHCDERGSAEYNLGLGDRRATSATRFPRAAGRSRGPAEDDQLRQRAARLHRIR